jgi:regulator of nucleoside diphosphate kinase
MTQMLPSKMPPIVLSVEDAARLEQLVDSPGLRSMSAIAQLQAEITRARILPACELPRDVVTMNAPIACVDERTGIVRHLTIVHPREADIAHGRVSVLSPVGMALLGLRVGQSIDWPAPAGQALRLTVMAVQPDSTAAAGAAS